MGSIEVGKAPYTLTVGYHSSKKKDLTLALLKWKINHIHGCNGRKSLSTTFVGFQPLETQGL